VLLRRAFLPFHVGSLILASCTGTIDSPGPGAWGDVPNSPNGVPAGFPGPNAPGAPSTGAPGVPGTSPGFGTTPAANGGIPGLPNAMGCTTPEVGPTPLRRLTHEEYDNAVAALLGDTTRPAQDFAADTEVGIFDNTAEAQTVPVLLADQYLSTADKLARAVDVKTLTGCDPAGAMGSACVRNFVTSFGRRAYRRPLEAAEIDRYVALHTKTASASDAQTGVRAIVAAVLSAPSFLFKPEYGGIASKVPGAMNAAPFELATRLASLIWSSIPDDALLDAAQSGQLATADQVTVQARRMLADPQAIPAARSFYGQWLGLPLLDAATKDSMAYPQWNEDLRAALRSETEHFIDYVLWQDDATLSTLLTASYSMLNPTLAKLYGAASTSPTSPSSPGATSAGANAGAADGFTRTALDPKQRSGVLTQASLMAAFGSPASSSPIKRGKLVRVRMLCQDLPDPPANVPAPPEPKQGVSTRERFAMHTNNPACSGCHNLIDGLGFGLEHYDGVGVYRTMDQGVQVDSSGEINTTMDIDGPYNGGPELAQRLASSEQVNDCVPTQWLRYALARREDTEDACSLSAVQESFASSGGNLRELVVALTRTDAFMSYRSPD